MTPQDRILDAAMRVFRRHGLRRSSIEQVAEAAGLTRQAVYHHFLSKEALFRACLETLYVSSLAAEIAAADAAEKAGGSLADILVAQVNARLRQLIASFDGSSHIEELFSEHLALGRDLYQKYAETYAEQIAETIERVRREQRLTLARGMTASILARYIEMTMHGVKSVYPSMLPAAVFLGEFEAMLRMLIAGALAPSLGQRPAKPVRARPSPRAKPDKKTDRKSGGRR
jgi:TetR/AcrR family acrAB operon transcriptional repressor